MSNRLGYPAERTPPNGCKRFTEEQIIGILKDADAGAKPGGLFVREVDGPHG